MSNQIMNEPEGEDLFGDMQSTPLQRNNPTVNEEEEEDTVAVVNPVVTTTDADAWKPSTPIMGESYRLVKTNTLHTQVANLMHCGLGWKLLELGYLYYSIDPLEAPLLKDIHQEQRV